MRKRHWGEYPAIDTYEGVIDDIIGPKKTVRCKHKGECWTYHCKMLGSCATKKMFEVRVLYLDSRNLFDTIYYYRDNWDQCELLACYILSNFDYIMPSCKLADIDISSVRTDVPLSDIKTDIIVYGYPEVDHYYEDEEFIKFEQFKRVKNLEIDGGPIVSAFGSVEKAIKARMQEIEK